MENSKLEQVTPTLSIYQRSGVFSYGTDAVLLARFVLSTFKTNQQRRLCDLCSGTGIIPLLICDSAPFVSAVGVEINNDACKLSGMSANYSGLSDRYTQYCLDIKDVRTKLRSESFDIVTCNPPYMTASSGYMCEHDYKTIARHEILCNIDDAFKAAFYLLKTGGSFYVVYRSDRLSSLFAAAANNRFQIKEMISFLSIQPPALSKLIVIRAAKDAKEGMKHYICNTQDFLSGEQYVKPKQ